MEGHAAERGQLAAVRGPHAAQVGDRGLGGDTVCGGARSTHSDPAPTFHKLRANRGPEQAGDMQLRP